MADYLARNRLWQPQSLQAKIANARVVVAGVGGLGWQIGAALVGLGVRTFHVFDPDRLETVNLNRLWGCQYADIGKAKVDLFATLTKGVDPDIEVFAYPESVPSVSFERALQQAEVVFGGFDSPEPRLATQLLALKHGVVYIDAGVFLKQVDGYLTGRGQVFVYSGPESVCFLCAGLRLHSNGYLDEESNPLPSSGTLNGILGNLAVSIWMKILLGEAVSQLTQFNWDQLKVNVVPPLFRRPKCPICGDGVRRAEDHTLSRTVNAKP